MTGTAPPPTTITFGTDGWRARIADDFTFENVRRCADGVAHYVTEQGAAARGVVIAYDRRFASEHFAAAAAEVLLAHDIPVALSVRAVPTQMSSFEVVERGAAAGIVITASHNPWVDNGFKVKAPTGAAAGADILSVIEARLAVNGGTTVDRLSSLRVNAFRGDPLVYGLPGNPAYLLFGETINVQRRAASGGAIELVATLADQVVDVSVDPDASSRLFAMTTAVVSSPAPAPPRSTTSPAHWSAG